MQWNHWFSLSVAKWLKFIANLKIYPGGEAGNIGILAYNNAYMIACRWASICLEYSNIDRLNSSLPFEAYKCWNEYLKVFFNVKDEEKVKWRRSWK